MSRGTSGITVISFSQAELKSVQIIALNLVHILLWQALITSQNFKGSRVKTSKVYFINVLSVGSSLLTALLNVFMFLLCVLMS